MRSFSQFCCTCLTTDAKLQPLTETNLQNQPTSEIIPQIVPELDFCGKEKVLAICDSCLRRFDYFCLFRKMCIGANRKLVDFVGKFDGNKSVELGFVYVDCDLDNQEPKGDMCNFDPLSGVKSEVMIEIIDEPVVKTEPEVDLAGTTTGITKTNQSETINRPYACLVCGRSFSKFRTLKNHNLIHTGEKPYKCQMCHKRFNQQAGLIAHRSTHTGEKNVQCHICKKILAHSSSLKLHLLLHTGEKPYKCDVCNRSFSHPFNLKQHKMIHTGEKPYKCETCGKSFIQKSCLKSHSVLHTGEKPYKCEACGKTFSQLSGLISHKVIHTGMKPHQCSICNKSFARAHYLKLHMGIHQRMNAEVT